MALASSSRSLGAIGRRIARRSYGFGRRTVEAFLRVNGQRSGAQLAFFVLLSVPPAMLVLLWALSDLLSNTEARMRVTDAIVRLLPSGEKDNIEQVVDGVARGAGGLGPFGAIVLLYSASNALSALREAVDDAWERTPKASWLVHKAADVGLVLVGGVLAVAVLALNLSGPVSQALGERVKISGAAEVMTTSALTFVVLLVLYRILPQAHVRWREAWPGALAGAVGVALAHVGLRFYFGSITDYSAIYGSIGGLLAVSLFVYVVSLVAVLGAHVVAQTGRPPLPPPP